MPSPPEVQVTTTMRFPEPPTHFEEAATQSPAPEVSGRPLSPEVLSHVRHLLGATWRVATDGRRTAFLVMMPNEYLDLHERACDEVGTELFDGDRENGFEMRDYALVLRAIAEFLTKHSH